jgi:hypothetical protein
VTDPAANDAVLRTLAWAHPVWMLLSLALAAAALRLGLALRRDRRARLHGLARAPEARPRGALRSAHLRLAKPAVVLVWLGFVGGPLSMWALRGRTPFDTVHALLGVTAALLFAGAALLGWRLEHARGRPVEAHALLGLLAVLAGAAAGIAGFVLLP